MAIVRAAGCPTPPDALAEARAIFFDEIARSGTCTDGLAPRIVPIFATSASMQIDLRRKIASAFDAEATPARTSSEIESVKAASSWRRRLAVFVSACLLIGAAAAAWPWFLVPEDGGEPVETLPPRNITEQPPVKDTRLDDYPPIPLAEGIKEVPQNTLTFYPRKQHPWRNWSIAAALLLPLFLAFLWIQLRNEQRLYWLRLVLRGPEAPSEVTAREYRADNIPLTNTLVATGENLGTAFEASSGLMDVPATVRATVKAGGFLTPVDQNAKGQADYIVLIEKKGPNDHLARLVDQILDRIDAAGLTIRRYYYRYEPIRAEPASSDRSALPLRDVVAGGQRHRFLVVGGSEGFFHPITGELQRWTEAFDTLASRTLLSARSMQNWTYEQDELQKVGFAIGEASPAGMASYGEAVAAGRESSAITIAPADLAPSQIDEKKIAREKRGWREFLSDFRPIGLAALATPLAATLGLGARHARRTERVGESVVRKTAAGTSRTCIS